MFNVHRTLGVVSLLGIAGLVTACGPQVSLSVQGDDADALQGQIDSASQGNGTVTLTQKSYTLSHGLVINAPIHIQGSRAGTTLNFTGTGTAITIGNQKGVVGAVIEGLTITGNANSIGISMNDAGTGANAVVDCTIRDCKVSGFKNGLVAKWAWDNLFSNLRFQNCATSAVLGSQVNGTEFTRCSFVSGNTGVQLTNCDGVNFTSCEFANLKNYGLALFQSVVNLTMPYFENTTHLATVGATSERVASVFTIQSGIVSKDIIKNNALDIIVVSNTRTKPDITEH
jgi:hypothetical protein